MCAARIVHTHFPVHVHLHSRVHVHIHTHTRRVIGMHPLDWVTAKPGINVGVLGAIAPSIKTALRHAAALQSSAGTDRWRSRRD